MIMSYFNFFIYTAILVYILVKVRGKLFLGLGSMLVIYQIFFTLKSVLSTYYYIAWSWQENPNNILPIPFYIKVF